MIRFILTILFLLISTSNSTPNLGLVYKECRDVKDKKQFCETLVKMSRKQFTTDFCSLSTITTIYEFNNLNLNESCRVWLKTYLLQICHCRNEFYEDDEFNCLKNISGEGKDVKR